MKAIKYRAALIYGLAALLVVLVVIYVVVLIMPNNKLKPFSDYYASTDPHIVLENQVYVYKSPEEITALEKEKADSEDSEEILLENEPIYKADLSVVVKEQVYLSAEFIKDQFDKYIFWEEEANNLTVTTENKVIRMKTEDLTYTVNNRPMKLSFPITRVSDKAYLPVNLSEELYNLVTSYNEEAEILVIDYTDKEYEEARVIGKKAVLRYEPDRKSFIQEKLNPGWKLTVFGEAGKKGEYLLVRSEVGHVGYVLAKDVGEFSKRPAKSAQEHSFPEKKSPSKENMRIYIGWDHITSSKQNENPSERIQTKAINVLSPTWFAFDKEKANGELTNIADLNYVKWAHSLGIQVWPLISDTNGKTCEAVLSSNEARQTLINQILSFISIYKLDGINIDFELVPQAAAPYYLQFFREISPLLKEQGSYLSVDMYVPSKWSAYYNRAEVSKVVDYVCVMTYDEYYSGSPESGPVASIEFVDSGIKNTLLEVPKEKVIMGLPYYVRIWREVMKGDTVEKRTIRDVGMNLAVKIFTEADADMEWDTETATTYGEYKAVEDGKNITYKAWIEDELSIGKKLELLQKYDIAGAAAWRLGLEKAEIPKLVEQMLKKQ